MWMEFLLNEVGDISAHISRLCIALENAAANGRSEARINGNMCRDFHGKKFVSNILRGSWKNLVDKNS